MSSSIAQPLLESLSVLVVDDHAINREFLRSGLGPHCARVDSAGSGREAIKLCSSREYDLILMDLHMPELDGLQTALALLELDTAPPMASIVFLTADTRAEDRLQLAGFNRVLSKPVALDELFQSLQNWLGSGDTGGSATIHQSPSARLLDRHAALGRCNQQDSLLKLMQERMAEDLRQRLGQLIELIRSESSLEAAELLHQWIGAAGYAGAHALTTRSRQLRRVLLQDSLDAGEFDQALALVDFLRCASATIQALESYPPTPDGASEAERRPSPDQA